MSPYTPFIPLHYLSIFQDAQPYYQHSTISSHLKTVLRNREIGETGPILKKIGEVADKSTRSLLHQLSLTHILRATELVFRSDTKRRLKALLLEDSVIDCVFTSLPSISTIDAAAAGFAKIGGGGAPMNMRTYRGVIGYLSVSINSLYEVITVMRPEDYVYHKIRAIMGKPMDTSRLITLVNREVDSPDYPLLGFKSLYKKYLEPQLQATKCHIWKVPRSYIDEMCFTNSKIEITDTNLYQRTQEIDKLVEEFYKSSSPVSTGSTTGVVVGVASDYTPTTPQFASGGDRAAHTPSNGDLRINIFRNVEMYYEEEDVWHLAGFFTTLDRARSRGIDVDRLISTNHPDIYEIMEEEEEEEEDWGVPTTSVDVSTPPEVSEPVTDEQSALLLEAAQFASTWDPTLLPRDVSGFVSAFETLTTTASSTSTVPINSLEGLVEFIRGNPVSSNS